MREEEMDCKDICELLTAYLDGEVTPEEKAYIEEHLQDCPHCRAELDALSATQMNLRRAFKYIADEASPSTQAWDKIRARLETSKSHRGFWSSFTLGRVATAAVGVVILVIAIVIWQYGGTFEAGSHPPAATTTTPAPTIVPTTTSVPPIIITIPPTTTTPTTWSLNVTAVTDKSYYLPGEKVEIKFSFTNVTQEPLTLSHFPPYIEIVRHGFLLRSFERGDQEVKLEPGEEITYTLVWDQLDYEGKPVNPAIYNINAEYITITKDSMPEIQESYLEIAKVVIEFPHGEDY